jgi:hypothetical protein
LDLTGDGKRFMIVPPNQGMQTKSTPLTVVLNKRTEKIRENMELSTGDRPGS